MMGGWGLPFKLGATHLGSEMTQKNSASWLVLQRNNDKKIENNTNNSQSAAAYNLQCQTNLEKNRGREIEKKMTYLPQSQELQCGVFNTGES